MSDNKELIWVDKAFAEEYKAMESDAEKEALVKRIIKDKRIDIEQDLESLSDDVLRFKAFCLTHKQAITKVYHEQAELLEKLWEEMGDIGSEVSRHASKIAREGIAPIRQDISALANDIKKLKEEVSGFNLSVPKEMVQIASMVGAMDDTTKVLLRDLLDQKTRIRTVGQPD